MDIINASGMRFSQKLRFRTAEIGFYLADDFCRICRGHQPFCWNPKRPAARKWRKFYAYITGTDFFAGTSYGSNLPEDSPATHYRNAVYRNFQYKTPTVIITAGVLRRIEIVLKGINPS